MFMWLMQSVQENLSQIRPVVPISELPLLDVAGQGGKKSCTGPAWNNLPIGEVYSLSQAVVS